MPSVETRCLGSMLITFGPQNKHHWIIVFRFIIEYSSSRHFGPLGIGLFLYEDFQKMIFWLVLKLEINYRVMIS